MGRQWPGFKERLHEAMTAEGYKNGADFSDRKGYRITYVYKWLAGTMPTPDTLYRIARDLNVSPAWLLFGDAVPREPFKRTRKVLVGLLAALILWGAAPAEAQAVDTDGVDQTPSYRTWLTRLVAAVSRWRAASVGDMRQLRAVPGLA